MFGCNYVIAACKRRFYRGWWFLNLQIRTSSFNIGSADVGIFILYHLFGCCCYVYRISVIVRHRQVFVYSGNIHVCNHAFYSHIVCNQRIDSFHVRAIKCPFYLWFWLCALRSHNNFPVRLQCQVLNATIINYPVYSLIKGSPRKSKVPHLIFFLLGYAVVSAYGPVNCISERYARVVVARAREDFVFLICPVTQHEHDCRTSLIYLIHVRAVIGACQYPSIFIAIPFFYLCVHL